MALSKNGKRIGRARQFEIRDEMEHIRSNSGKPESHADKCYCGYGEIVCPLHNPDAIALRKILGEREFKKYFRGFRLDYQVRHKLRELSQKDDEDSNG